MITLEDRHEYPYHTDKSILGIKLIGGLSNKILRAYINDDKAIQGAVVTLMGPKTNPNWILGRVAEEMLARDLIDETEFDKLNR